MVEQHLKTKPESHWTPWIGRQVTKTSGKPFKSRLKTNTVKAVVMLDLRGMDVEQIAHFTFLEDDSMVECWRCEHRAEVFPRHAEFFPGEREVLNDIMQGGIDSQ